MASSRFAAVVASSVGAITYGLLTRADGAAAIVREDGIVVDG